MSEQRVYDWSGTFTIARVNGIMKSKKESCRFELYNAGQFKLRLDGKSFSRGIPAMKSKREEFYLTMYRVKIGGKWHRPNRRYEFFTFDEAFDIIKQWVQDENRTNTSCSGAGKRISADLCST